MLPPSRPPSLPFSCPAPAGRLLRCPRLCSITGLEEAGLTGGGCLGARGAGRVPHASAGERRSGRPARRRRRGPRRPRPRCRTPTSSGRCTRRWPRRQWSAPAAGARSLPAGSRPTSRSASGRGARPAAWGTAGTTAGAEGPRLPRWKVGVRAKLSEIFNAQEDYRFSLGGLPRRKEPTGSSAPGCSRPRLRPPLSRAAAPYPAFSTSPSSFSASLLLK